MRSLENPFAPKPPEIVTEKQSIIETEASISYLGVKLKKAKVAEGQFVPKLKEYKDFINDTEIALPLQRDIAVAFLSGEPMLVEGGTSLGKTTTVRKMAAELGWEVHYANLNGATDVEDLMGRYIPNPHKTKPEEPEYVFADGKVTSGLRQEEGKVKVIILDEFNAAAPNILIRLHEVLDALERGGEVVLSEDASEEVGVNKEKTKIVALMNSPGKGYFGREPLDPAQLRRWTYKKMPSELPAGTFSFATDALFGMSSERKTGTTPEVFASREQSLDPEQLQEIPGIREILEKYKEFHKAAKQLLQHRRLAEDQPQAFTYDDRMEPRRVRDFVLRFYNGDVNETFQRALRYYYANKLESDVDREKLGELIRLVECKPSVAGSKRKGIKRSETTGTGARLSESKEDEPYLRMMRLKEEKRLKGFFGTDIDVPPLPDGITSERAKEWRRFGFELRYLPPISLKASDEYPGWKKKPDKGIDLFYNLQKIQKLPENQENPHLHGLAPNQLPGAWVLKDERAKPNYKNGEQTYDHDELIQGVLQKLAKKEASIVNAEVAHGRRNQIDPKVFDDPRFWEEFRKALKLEDLPSATLRLPRVIEANMMGQDLSFDGTNTLEWCEEYYQSGKRLISGSSDRGGASHVGWNDGPLDIVGFRPMVVFSSERGSLKPGALESWEKKTQELRKEESKKLSAFFEKKIDVPPLPPQITLERLEYWEGLGMELHYFPAENMTKDRQLKAWNKKPNDWFYMEIAEGDIPSTATQLPEGWFVVEGRQKPSSENGRQMYENDPLVFALEELNLRGVISQSDHDGTKLDPKTRFGLSPKDFEKPEVMESIADALDFDRVSLTEAITWNLLANIHHPEWGTTNTHEWQKEKYGFLGRLASGSSGYDGASRVGWNDRPDGTIGFRPLGRFF